MTRQYVRRNPGDSFGPVTLVARAGRRDGSPLWQLKCDCGREWVGRIDRLVKSPNPMCGDWSGHRHHLTQDVVTYAGAHDRVKRKRGSASEHLCVDCGGQAEDWSYDNADRDEMVAAPGTWGAGMRYSQKIEHYQPRCTPCHARFDEQERRGAA